MVAAGYFGPQILSPAIKTATLVEAGGEKDTAAAIARAMETNDTVGGGGRVRGKKMYPRASVSPLSCQFEAALGMIAFGIPAVKRGGFGAGFASSRSNGSLHNDPFVDARGKTSTNNAGESKAE
jgi:chorismate synthase